MSKVDLLICGAGSAGLHCGMVAEEDGRGQVVGLFEPVPGQMEKARAKFPNAAASADDYERLLGETKPDAVVIAGPDHLHAEQTLLALEYGCHCLVEKPLTTSVEDAQRVIEKAERLGLHIMTDQTMRYVYPWKEMVLATKAGDIGDVFFLQGDYIHDMMELYKPDGKHATPWRADPVNPQSILLGGGIHPIDLMLWAIDSPVEEVFMYSNKLCDPVFPTEDCHMLIMRFANEAIAKCFVTAECSGPDWEDKWHKFYECYGTNGTLSHGKLYVRGQETVDLEDTSSPNLIGGHGWGGSVPDFLSLLEGKIENPIDGRAGARNVSVCIAGLEAVRTGQPQRPIWF
jgi:predicted dehydrogenase